ncbi:MAG: hypothetical protein CR967_05285 [Proteobacteria bacterium]|nr:MAG: hypothetical protein CR967_05285 [Pseudomonadota bacterium]
MKNMLLIIDQDLKENDLMLNYIFEHYKKHFGKLGDIYFVDAKKPDASLFINDRSKKYEHTTAYIHKNNPLLDPIDGDNINILFVRENEKLPDISSSQNTTISTLYLINENSYEEKVKLLEKNYKITTSISQITPNWLQMIVKSPANKQDFYLHIKEMFKNKIFIADNPIEHIVKCLAKNQKTISVAESCTGGLISSLITSVPGSSDIYEGGMTTYSNRIKNSWLGVSEKTLKTQGAVSEATIKEMLKGILRASGSNFSMATSGIAGPSGGSKTKPVGTIFVGVANSKGDMLIERLSLKGDRAYIQNQSAFGAFKLLFDLEPDLFFK